METPVCPRQHTGRRESRERRCVVTAARPEDEWPPAQRQLEGGDSPLAWSLGPILTWINHRDPEAVQLAAAVIDLRLSAVSVCGSQYLMETEFPTTTVWTLCTVCVRSRAAQQRRGAAGERRRDNGTKQPALPERGERCLVTAARLCARVCACVFAVTALWSGAPRRSLGTSPSLRSHDRPSWCSVGDTVQYPATALRGRES
ncbi:uncharacterized protein LOC125714561 isoform X1 [Brienomyrus brachyistius]|uniref:uncharacterized protein LOC125714561 isoform X1 n=1 Tax=Brienomyrus brachyistius TaxID=42636 RepID=UPI0020B3815F|nr:uncharacterized protein LOC125714561 isoform X1 [Brienomyrus brachyistius]